MKRFITFATVITTLTLAALAVDLNEDFFIQRSQLLDYVGEQSWTLKSTETIYDAGRLTESLNIDNIDAYLDGTRLSDKATLTFLINKETMALMVMASTEHDVLFEHIFNSAMEPTVFAFDIGNVSELSLAAISSDGTKTWISFANPLSGDDMVRFAVHEPYNLADVNAATLRLSPDQFNIVSAYMNELSEHNFINSMPYAPIQY